MAATPESVAQHNAYIAEVLKEVTAASAAFARLSTQNVGLTTPAEVGAVNKSHVELMASVNRLKRAAYGPVNSLIANFEEVC